MLNRGDLFGAVRVNLLLLDSGVHNLRFYFGLPRQKQLVASVFDLPLPNFSNATAPPRCGLKRSCSL